MIVYLFLMNTVCTKVKVGVVLVSYKCKESLLWHSSHVRVCICIVGLFGKESRKTLPQVHKYHGNEYTI